MIERNISPYCYWANINWRIRKMKRGTKSIYEGRLSCWIVHRMPDWMSLKLHLTLEKLINKIPHPMRTLPIIGHFYHLFHGLICAIPIKRITPFLKNLKTTLHPQERFLILDKKNVDTEILQREFTFDTSCVVVCELPPKQGCENNENNSSM